MDSCFSQQQLDLAAVAYACVYFEKLVLMVHYKPFSSKACVTLCVCMCVCVYTHRVR
jgi:hypothetical protein